MHVVQHRTSRADTERLKPLVRLRSGPGLLPFGMRENAAIAADRILLVAVVTIPVALAEHRVRRIVREHAADLVKDRLGHDQRYGIDPSKIKADLGWYPETPFEEGIVKTIRWNLENRP